MKQTPLAAGPEAAARARKQRTPLIAALEPRMLFDGAAVVEAAQALTDLDYQEAAPQAADGDGAGTPLAVAPEPQRREWVFVDASLPDHQALLAGVSPGAQVHLIESGVDGWARMAQVLEGQTGIDAIHVLGHGTTGQATLGTATLDAASLELHAASLQRIGDALSQEGDVLLYGCDIGAGETGAALLTQLSRLSRADVAASADATGQGGDWDLEATTGPVEAASLAFESWNHQLGTPVVAGLADRSYTEQEPAKLLAPLFSISGGQYYDDGYFEVRGTGSATETLTLSSSATPNVAGQISVSGSEVRVGTGSGTMRVGTIDSYYNGTGGRALRINFAAPLTNGGFEDSLDNWTVNNSFGGLPGDDHGGTFFGPINQSASIDTNQYSEGSASLKLQINGGVSVGYGTAHGPEVTSAEFSATRGDLIALDWKALDSGDDYDVYGFLVDNATGQSYQLFYSRGDYIDWTKLAATIPVTSDRLQFKFYGGTFDATGGTYVGSTLYIDNVRVISRIVTDSTVAQIGRQVTYFNASDAPPASRTLTFEAKSSDGATGSSSMTLSLVAVPDPPVAGSVNRLASEDSTLTFAAIDFTGASSDPDGPYAPIKGILITALPAHGTLRLAGNVLSANAYVLVAELGSLTYTPDANWHGTETFSWLAHDGGLYSTSAGTVTIDVASVDDAPVLTTSSGNVTSINGSAVAVDPNLNLYDVDNGEAGKDSFSQFKVYINAPQVGDVLDVSSLPGGFSKHWDSATYVLTISGTGTAAQYRDILRQVTYSASAASGTRTVTFTSSANVGFGGHYYEYVASNVNWTTAYNNARNSYLAGMQGYLATITSDAEYNFIYSKIRGSAWIGLTSNPTYAAGGDNAGDFRWINGSPEAGTNTFVWAGKFEPGEPNNSSYDGDTERYVQMFGANSRAPGRWNDLVNYGSGDALYDPPGYIIEYSGTPNDPSLLTATRDVSFRSSNNAPTVSGFTASTGEDGTLTFSSSLFTARFSDTDGQPLAKVKITSLPANGTLTLDGRTVAANQELGASDLGRLTYTPAANWNGTDSFGWNGFDGNTYAGSAATVTITVNAVNDAPTLNASASPYIDGLAEDATVNAGTLVSTILARSAVSDVDGPASGLAVTTVDNTNGLWEYNTGNGWTAFSATTGQRVDLGSSARLLNGAALVRFVPNANWNGTATLSIRPWDTSSGTSGGTADPFAAGGNTSIGALSTDLDTVSVTVSAVNDAPQVVAASTVMVAFNEDETSLNAQTVGGFAAAAIADLDAAPLYGIAVIGQVDGNGAGTWQYSVDNGQNWTAIGTVGASGALLLRASDQVRFVPDLENGGTGSLTWRAWDRTDSGTPGSKVDLSSEAGGGTSAYSTGQATSTITLASVNDAPVITQGATITFTGTDEDTASGARTVAAILEDAGWSDVDTGAAKGMAVTGLTQRNHWQYSTDGTDWVNMTDTTVVGGNSGGTPNAVGSTRGLLLSAGTWVRYNPDAERGETASFSFRAWDGSSGTASTAAARSFGDPTATNAAGGTGAFSTQSATVSIAVSDVNDAPALDATATPGFNVTGATEDDTAISAQTVADFAVASSGITEVDDTTLFGIAVTGQADGDSGGTWQYSIDGGVTWTAIGAVSDSAALLLRGQDQVRFAPNALNGGTGSLTWRAWDRTDSAVQGTRVDLSGVTGGGTSALSSAAVTRTTTLASVNDAPTADSISEDGYVLGSQVSKAVAGVFSDVDRGDVLTFSATGLPDGITIHPATGILSGVPIRPGNYEVVITADDSHGGTVSTTWRVRVVAPVTDGDGGGADARPRPADGGADEGGAAAPAPRPPAFQIDAEGIPGHESIIPVPEFLRQADRQAPIGAEAEAGLPPGPGTAVPDTAPPQAAGIAASVGSDGQLQVDRAGAPGPAASARQAVDRVDVAVGANGRVDLEQRPRNEGEIAAGLMLVEMRRQAGDFQIEIADFRASQVREYRATLVDGKPLPAWVRINPLTGQVDGQPPQGVRVIDLRIIALDVDGGTRLLEVRVNLAPNPAGQPQAADPARPAAQTGFAAQLQLAQAARQGQALADALRQARPNPTELTTI